MQALAVRRWRGKGPAAPPAVVALAARRLLRLAAAGDTLLACPAYPRGGIRRPRSPGTRTTPLAVRLEVGGRRVLFLGDIEQAGVRSGGAEDLRPRS
jgi:hypothetical protein